MSNEYFQPTAPVPPPPSSSIPQPPEQGTHRSQKGGRWLPFVLISAIIGAAIGVSATYLLMRSDAGQEDAAVACSQLEQINFPLNEGDLDLNGPLFWRLYGIGGFASAGAFNDDVHTDFHDHGQALIAGISQLNIDVINESVQDLSTLCSDIDR